MNNPNSLKKDGVVDSSWEDLQNEGDKFDAQAAREAVEAKKRLDIASKKEYDDYQDLVNKPKESSGIYYADGLDVRERPNDTSGLLEKSLRSGEEYAKAWDAYKPLSTESSIKERAEALRNQAKKEAEEQKFYEKGLPFVLNELQTLDEQLANASDPDAQAKIKADREKLQEKAIMLGRGVIEQEQNEANDKPEVASVPDEEIAEENKEQSAEQKLEKSMQEMMHEYADKIDTDTLKSFAGKESQRIHLDLKALERFDKKKDEVVKRGFIEVFRGFFDRFFDKRDRKEITNRLKRHGYQAGAYNEDSSIFKELKTADWGSGVSGNVLENIAKERAMRWKKIDIVSKGEYGKEYKKVLKKYGFSKLPEKWNDEGFTSEEIARMASRADELLSLKNLESQQ